MLACSIGTALSLGTASAADFSDKTWPCIQPKVPHLSLGQMWSGVAATGDWRADPDIAELAPRLAIRRTSLEEADRLVTDFAARAGADRAARLALLYAAVFEIIDQDRSTLIAGIGRYAAKQAEHAARIDAKHGEMTALVAAEPRDEDRIEELTDEIAWDTRIYKDRAQSLTYVCETPVLLEQRAFAIGRKAQELSQ